MSSDAIDRILEEAGIVRDDASHLAVLSRLFRLTAYAERRLAEIYGRFDLTHGEVDVLMALARAGDRTLTPTSLSLNLMCSNGAMTNRLNRLEAAGHIRRVADPNDRRGTRIGITRGGRSTINRVTAERAKVDAELVPGLGADERKQLVGLLRKLLASYEDVSTSKHLDSLAAR